MRNIFVYVDVDVDVDVDLPVYGGVVTLGRSDLERYKRRSIHDKQTQLPV